MKHVVKHDLGQEKAKKVAVAAFETYRTKFEKYSPSANWVSDSRCEIGFNAKGVSLRGSITVAPSEIVMELDVPFLLKPFQGKALGLIEGEIREWMAKAKAGEI